MKKIYIAGKITGDPDYKAKFLIAQKELQSHGHKVMNPAELPEGFEFSEYMKICLAMIDVCDTVYMLNNWGLSKGASIEYLYAQDVGKKILFQPI